MITDDDVQNLSPAADKDACLPVYAARDAGKTPCELMCDNPLRGYPLPVEPLEFPDLTRFQTGGVAVEFVYGVSPILKKAPKEFPPGPFQTSFSKRF